MDQTPQDERGARAVSLAEENEALRAELEEARRVIDRLAGAREMMMVNLSHELRTPLTVIRGYVDLMQGYGGNPPAERMRDWLRAIRAQADRLADHVSDIFTHYAVASCEQDWDRERAPLKDIIEDACRPVQEVAEARGVTIGIGRIPRARIQCHRTYLVRAVGALVANASRFTRENTAVSVRAAWLESGSAVSLRITDHGPGLDARAGERAFDEFWQTADVLVDKPAGLGLGLSLARAVAEKIGGECRLVETGDNGSTFEMVLPAFPV